MYRLTGFAHSLLMLATLLSLAVLATGCGNGEKILSDHPETVPARIALLMSPNLLADDITSARLIITAPDFKMMEFDLSIDLHNRRATGSFELPSGNARLIRAEAYAGNDLRLVGERRMDIHADALIEIQLLAEANLYRVEVGKTFIVPAAGNPSTGFTWVLEFDSEMMEIVSREFVSDSPPLAVGASGYEMLKLKGLIEGQTAVNMVYKQPWQEDAADERSVTVDIMPASKQPLMSLSLATLDFGMWDTEDLFVIGNSGSGALQWSMAPNFPNWLVVSPTIGRSSSNEVNPVSVKINREGLKPSAYEHRIAIISNGGTGSVLVKMTIPEAVYF